MSARDEDLARRIRAARESLGMSQEGLAEAVSARGHGFTQPTVYKIEQGKRKVLATELVAIANALEVSPVALIGHGEDRLPIVSAGARADEAMRRLRDAADAYALAIMDYASALDHHGAAVHPVDEEYARGPLARQTPAWIASQSVETVDAALHRKRVEVDGFSLTVLEALRTDFEHFHGESDG